MLDVTVAAPRHHAHLTVFPLIARRGSSLPYTLMSDALRATTLRITEVGSGTVPELVAISSSDAPILILDGEQLIGARQNRMTNRSIILPARSKTHIPVSCMEQGRWHFEGDAFAPAEQNAPSQVRRRAREVEAMNVDTGGGISHQVLRDAQGAVWSAIADKSRKVRHSSATGALNELYTAHAGEMNDWIAAFPLVDEQVGMLAFMGGDALGLDVIGCTRLYAQVHERLLRGYVMDALGESGSGTAPTDDVAQRYMEQVRSARRVEAQTVGTGEYSVLSGDVIGGELRDGERLVHLSAFPRRRPTGDGGGPFRAMEDPIAPPSRRRRRPSPPS